MMSRAAAKHLAGYKEIAIHLEARVGLSFSVAAVRALASRPIDPLPVRVFGAGATGRIVGEADAVNAWCERQWRSKRTRTSRAP